MLGGDMKFLHTAMGLDACNSVYSCLLCKIKKAQFVDATTEMRPEDKRTLLDQRERLRSNDKEQGYELEPIFDYIEYDDIVFDTLHLLLRVAGNFKNNNNHFSFLSLTAIYEITYLFILNLPKYPRQTLRTSNQRFAHD